MDELEAIQGHSATPRANEEPAKRQSEDIGTTVPKCTGTKLPAVSLPDHKDERRPATLPEAKRPRLSDKNSTQDPLTRELRRVLNLPSLSPAIMNGFPACVENDHPCLDLKELPAPEPSDMSEFALTDHYPLRLWLISNLGARLNWLVEYDSKRLVGILDAQLPDALSTCSPISVPTHLRGLVRWSKRVGVKAIGFRTIAEYTNRLRHFGMELSLSIAELMGLIVEVEKRLKGLPLGNADQWSKPPAVANVEEAQDAPPKKLTKPQQEEEEQNPLRQLAGPQLPASQGWAMTALRYTSQPDAPKQSSRPEKMQVYRDPSAMQ